MYVSSSSACLRSVTSAKTPSKQASPVVVDDPAGLIAHPHDVAVGVQEAILVVEQARLLGLALVAHHPRAVVGVDALQPQLADPPSTAPGGSRASTRSAGSRRGSARPSPPPSGTRRPARPRAALESAVRGGARRRCHPWVGGARPTARLHCPIGTSGADGLGSGGSILPGCDALRAHPVRLGAAGHLRRAARARGHARRPPGRADRRALRAAARPAPGGALRADERGRAARARRDARAPRRQPRARGTPRLRRPCPPEAAASAACPARGRCASGADWSRASRVRRPSTRRG